MTKILITGGAGYIGSHCVLEALKQNYEVSVIDNLERGYLESITRIEKLTNKKIDFHKVDLREYDSLLKTLEEIKPDYVMHFAGYKSVGEGERRPKIYYDNNTGVVKNLLKAMGIVGCRNLIFSSTASVYGNPDKVPVTETSPTKPISVYGKSKLMAENIIKNYCEENPSFSAIAFRYFNVIGADSSGQIGEDPSRSENLLPIILNTIVGNREEFELFGNEFKTSDGTQERDYIDVVDLVQAHLLAVSKKLRGYKVLNLSTGKPISCLKLINMVRNIVKCEINYKVTEPRKGDPISCYAENELAKKVLDWSIKNQLNDSIANQWNWCQKNPKGYN